MRRAHPTHSLAAAAALAAGCAHGPPRSPPALPRAATPAPRLGATPPPPPARALRPVGDREGLARLAAPFAIAERERQVRARTFFCPYCYVRPEPGTQPPSAAASAGAAEPSVTNNQEQGVDEGDIVKAHGEHLLVLHRGRLFSVRAGSGPIALVDRVDAFAPGEHPASWYDELLVAGDTAVVVGYSYARRATEVVLFDVSAAGRLAYRATLYVRSGDYYSSRNYASRLVGQRLILYMPIPLFGEVDTADSTAAPDVLVPAVRRRTTDPDWAPVIDYARLYGPVQPIAGRPWVHTLLECDVGSPALACRARGVIGPAARTFYVSPRAVYVWVSPDGDGGAAPAALGSVLYRFPLDGGADSALRAAGGPIDSFSFRESDTELSVLLSARSRGDAMWRAEGAAGDLALLTVPLALFADDVPSVVLGAYRPLPPVAGAPPAQNRFIGSYLLYGTGGAWLPASEAPRARTLYAHSLPTGQTTALALSHSVERIEALGRDALIAGSDERGALALTTLALDDAPALAGTWRPPAAALGERRSHAFFFHATGEREGVVGMPVARQGEAVATLLHVAAEVDFLRVDALRLAPLGALVGDPAVQSVRDGCRASCADWYGNSRAVFYRGRTFGLLGYELVEAEVARGGLREVARLDLLGAAR